jgi:VWFA-related protein
MNVSVTDRGGKTLAGLKKEDFKVAENGEEQQVEFFAPSTAPFNLVLLLDLSGSITDKIEVVKSAALHFLDVVGPEDKVAVVTFTRQPTVISNLTNNRDLLRKRIKAIKKPEGGTAFYEALWFTLVDTLRGTEGQRNAIVIMSDGVDNSLERFNPAHSRVSFDQLARKLQGSDSIVFPIYLDTEYEEVFERGNSSSESYAIARDQLAHIADITGGRMFQAQHPEDLAGVYNQVAEALRTVYSVGYYPTNGQRDGSFRRVSIGVDKTGVVVRSRKGYYAR